VAIVGRPNVGKSSLFNRLLRRREAIVLDRPGVTRDRLEREGRLATRAVLLIDTGGIIPHSEDDLYKQVSRQALAALDAADAILLVIDARAGVTPLDEQIAEILRRATVPVVLVANKVDGEAQEALVHDGWRIGLGEPLAVSAETGRGVEEMADRVEALLPPPVEGEGARLTSAEEGLPDPREELCVAVVGRPNVGKSSLVNRLAGEERVTVSPVPGTTRDAVDVLLRRDGNRIRLVDTAGIRRRAKVETRDESVGILMTRRRLARSHVAIFVVDAVQGITSGDVAIAGEILETGRPMVLAFNKWDLVADAEARIGELDLEIERRLAFAPKVPRVTVSAISGQRAFKLLDLAREQALAATRRIPTSELNRFLERSLAELLAGGGSTTRMLYVTQTGTLPPRFAIFCREPEQVDPATRRYLENRLREEFDLGPVPVVVDLKLSPRRR
jgi:GTP-binding protein